MLYSIDEIRKSPNVSGISVRCGAILIPEYGNPEEGDLSATRDHLIGLPWITKRTARHECFMSETPREYSYGAGRGEETYTSRDFTPQVADLMAAINKDLGSRFNVCFLNKYDDEKQHLGWHADDFPGMDPKEPIAVLSFGAAREIWVKDQRGIPCPKCKGAGSFPAGTRQVCQDCGASGFVKGGEIPKGQRIMLPEASLFIMPPGYQDTHFHRIPKHGSPCDWRISLTFRSFK